LTRESSIQLQRIKGSEQTCPYCRDELAPRGPALSCSECSTRYHLGCVSELGESCALYGCPGELRRAGRSGPARRSELRRKAPAPRRSRARSPWIGTLVYLPGLSDQEVQQLTRGVASASAVVLALISGTAAMGWAGSWIYRLWGPNAIALAALLCPLVLVAAYAKLAPTRGRASRETSDSTSGESRSG